jgi:hypothetical protein
MGHAFTPEFHAAVDFLASLKKGDRVVLGTRNHRIEMTVSRTIHRADGPFGSYESSRVTLTTENGYTRDVCAQALVDKVTTCPRTGLTHPAQRVTLVRSID